MRLLVSLILMMILLAGGLPALAQDSTQNYYSAELGVSFSYPNTWQVNENRAAQTITAGEKDDLVALAEGRIPKGYLFSLTMSSFRQMGAAGADDLVAVLERIADSSSTPQPTALNGVSGFSITETNANAEYKAYTAVLSVGRRRAAVIRYVGAPTASDAPLNVLLETLRFFPPPSGMEMDGVGAALWQISAESMPNLMSLAVTPEGTTLLATDRTRGVWQINTNGVPSGMIQQADIASYAGIAVQRDNTLYIADPQQHMLWIRTPKDNALRRLLGGQVGTGRGAFGETSPTQFALTARYVYVLDENENGLRVQLFNYGGTPITFWAISNELPEGASNPRIAVDGEGNLYVYARGMDGLLKINAAGNVVEREIGAAALAGSEVTAFVVDRFDNFYMATSDQGILHLEADGTLIGVIGEPYDESAPPKSGQLARPIALALDPTSTILYVADVGKYPQIVAFALDGNTAVNLASGTKAGSPIAYGEALEGEITEKAFFILHTFEGKVDEAVNITLRGIGFDAYVDVLLPDGNVLAYADDLGKADGNLSATDAVITALKLPQNGTYTLRVTRFGREAAHGANTTGNYELRLERAE